MAWMLTIERSNNGYVLSTNFDNDEEISHKVIEEEENQDSELESAQRLLWEVKEFFGIYHNKHAKKNLYVEIKETED